MQTNFIQKGGDFVGKKHVNEDKGRGYQSSRGRNDGSGPSSNKDGRERNVGHKRGEEHSRTAKGNRG